MIFTSFLLVTLLVSVEALPKKIEIRVDTPIGYVYVTGKTATAIKESGNVLPVIQEDGMLGAGTYLSSEVLSDPVEHLGSADWHECMISAHKQRFITKNTMHQLVFVNDEKALGNPSALKKYLNDHHMHDQNPILFAKLPNPGPGGAKFTMRIPPDALRELGYFVIRLHAL
ncbi:hypothetical protein BDP27DRAFT_1438657 [Rhodocollybia butyracea]|uniref:Uncharacterized protein n=1 Tax=Rhodocollybia butyracea TaxID=206335 RepID=A0A9P5P3C2_9AGAR|nr:hypothetical protein BDP27DRAFT_1438657 [Rhodocollybia butyracea]